MGENNIRRNKRIAELDKYRLEENSDIVNCLIFSKSGRHTPIYAKIIGFIEKNNIIVVRTLEFYLIGTKKVIHYHNMIGFAKIIKYKNFEALLIIDHT